MGKVLIVAAAREQDGRGSLDEVIQLRSRITGIGCEVQELYIAPLAAGWHTPLDDVHFRSGCAPIEALQAARERIQAGAEAVLIRGEEPLKTGYTREERLRLMAIYGEELPITEAYTRLAERFMARHRMGANQFTSLADALFLNYRKTYLSALDQGRAHFPLPAEPWYKPVTSLFRGVDCANPLVDFHGQVLLCSESLARRLAIPARQCVEVRGIGLGFLDGDGEQALPEIAEYQHLQRAVTEACEQAGIDLAAAFLQRKALLEAYTCYPVVPLALLLASGIVRWVEEIPAVLKEYAITLTGGMNLARAAWNNPALNGLIETYRHLVQDDAPIGAVHGNGGLGYRQGLAILGR